MTWELSARGPSRKTTVKPPIWLTRRAPGAGVGRAPGGCVSLAGWPNGVTYLAAGLSMLPGALAGACCAPRLESAELPKHLWVMRADEVRAELQQARSPHILAHVA